MLPIVVINSKLVVKKHLSQIFRALFSRLFNFFSALVLYRSRGGAERPLAGYCIVND